jgi:carbamoyl-phosphate synthase large subunit
VALAKRLQVVGLMNIQWAVQGDKVFILEANPRASRTVPFVSKAIGVPLAKIASLLMIGKTLKEIGFTSEVIPKHAAVKEAVLPFNKFPSSDMLLSPEMRSTGEVMGIDFSYPAAFVKAQMAAGTPLPLEGTILLSLAEEDKKQAVVLAQDFIDLGFRILATRGTYVHLIAEGMNPSQVEMAFQIGEGRPNIVDRIKNREIQLFIMTPGIDKDTANEKQVRRTSVEFKVPMITTLAAAKVAAQGIRILKSQEPSVICMQDYHAERVVPRGLATSISS